MAIILSKNAITPALPGSDSSPCVGCLKVEGRWIVSGDSHWCAYCIFYKTPWGVDVRDSLDALVSAVESNLHRPLRDLSGELIPGECDRIMSSIVVTSAYVNSRTNADNTRT